jgi:phenylalanyl-tRNA synthetase beta chain
LGVLGLVDQACLSMAGLDVPVTAAELDLDRLLALFPPRGRVQVMPQFPAIERDLSLVVDESVPWARVAGVLEQARLDHFESLSFVGVFRGEQVGPGKKSVTARLRFRSADRTLRHDEIDPQIAQALERTGQALGAVLRA